MNPTVMEKIQTWIAAWKSDLKSGKRLPKGKRG